MQKRSYSDVARVAHLTSVRGVLLRPEVQMRIGLLHPLERCRLVASYRDRQFQDPLQQFRMPEPRLRFGCRALALDNSGQLAGSELVGVGMPASPVGQLHQLGLRRARVVGGGYNHADKHTGESSHHLQCRPNVRVVSDNDRRINLPVIASWSACRTRFTSLCSPRPSRFGFPGIRGEACGCSASTIFTFRTQREVGTKVGTK